jgi:tetratricopeptide (TPR) repeat protein
MTLSRAPLVLTIAMLAACGGAKSGGAAPVAPAGPPPEPVHAPEFTTGLAAFDQGDYAGARKAFEAASKSNPNDYDALWNLGQSCEKLGDVPAAAAAYKAEIAIKPDADRAAAELANLYVGTGNTDEALATATAGLAKHPGSAVLHAAMGVALATRGDKDPAIQQFNQAIQVAPGDPMLSYTYAVWLNKWHVRGAAPLLDTALPLVKNDFPMLVSIGHEYRLAGEFDSCVRTFDTAVKSHDGGEVRTERALCKLGLKDEAGALTDLKSAVTTESSYPQAHFFLAGRLASTKHFKEAALEYAAYLQLAPSGSLADQANERLKAAQDAAEQDKQNKGVAATPKKKPK